MPNHQFEIDPLSGAAVRLEMLFQDRVVAVGSGFVWNEAGRASIVTAWHNVTGTHPETGQPLSPTAVRPDAYRAHLIPKHTGAPQSISGRLYGDDEVALFRSHNVYANRVDVVALDFKTSALSETMCQPINLIPDHRIVLRVGAGAFIIGFPRGLSMHGLPIWKRGTIASEPTFSDVPRERGHYLIDAATREGMSGAAAILLSEGGYQDEDGSAMMGHGRWHRFLGLYSGRVASTDQMEAQIGMIWPARLVREVAISGIPDEFTLYG